MSTVSSLLANQANLFHT